MRKKLAIFFVLLFIAAINMSCTDKYLINHKGKIIEISANAWEAHKAHGDTFIDFVWD